MCGIAGAVKWGNPETLRQMIDLQQHRGPDDQGTWSTRLPDGGFVGLGSRRLAILDLSEAGHMPMSTSDGKYTIVYNGECYNYPELRKQLEGRGYSFRSHSDTEAILYAYREYGPDCVQYLDGMFAIAIWDGERNQLFVARDHFGIKPFYYVQRGDRFAFASEVKALLCLPDFGSRMNYGALRQYLTFLWVPDPDTMFESVFKLPAGHYGIFKDGKFDIQQYWDLKFPKAGAPATQSEADLAHDVRQLFYRSVKRQMLSDVPLGAFLSAGMDSSSIVAAMTVATNQPVRTFTIGFPPAYTLGEVTFDDVAVARRTAKAFGCDHTEITVAPDVVDLLPKLVYHMDEPTADPAIITCYLVSREARKTVTVLQSGIGGDEIFAGYRKYRAHYMAEQYRSLPKPLRAGFEPIVRAVPSMRNTLMKGRVRLAKKMIRSCYMPPRERFIEQGVYLDSDDIQTLCTPEALCSMNGASPQKRHMQYFENVKDADFLHQMLYLDVKAFMVSLNLTYNDKMTMASSVEARVPFLDRTLVEFVASNVPPQMKLHGNTMKYLLRTAMAPILPAEVIRQKKAGFGAPVDYWLANDLKPMIADLLSESNLRDRGLFDPTSVRRMITEHHSGRRDWSMQIWQLVTLELWMQTFLDTPSLAASIHASAPVCV